jgi:hypothetical protein
MNIIGGVMGLLVGGALGVICGFVSIAGLSFGLELSAQANGTILTMWTVGGAIIGAYKGSQYEIKKEA